MAWQGQRGQGWLDVDNKVEDGLVRTMRLRMAWQGRRGGGWYGKDDEVKDGTARMTRSRMAPRASLTAAASFPLHTYKLMHNVMNHTHPS